MITHGSFDFREKVGRLIELEQAAHILNDEILEHGRYCGMCLSAQINAGVLPEMFNPITPAESAEEYFFLTRN